MKAETPKTPLRRMYAKAPLFAAPRKGRCAKKMKNLKKHYVLKGDNPKTDNSQKKNNILDATKGAKKGTKNVTRNAWKLNKKHKSTKTNS